MPTITKSPLYLMMDYNHLAHNSQKLHCNIITFSPFRTLEQERNPMDAMPVAMLFWSCMDKKLSVYLLE